MRESTIEEHFCRGVRGLGGQTRKLSYQGRGGAPDQLVLFGGYHCLVELKAPGEKPRVQQAREHAVLTQAGFQVWTLDTIEAVDAWLGTMEQLINGTYETQQ